MRPKPNSYEILDSASTSLKDGTPLAALICLPAEAAETPAPATLARDHL
jgi:hypothetical protein